MIEQFGQCQLKSSPCEPLQKFHRGFYKDWVIEITRFIPISIGLCYLFRKLGRSASIAANWVLLGSSVMNTNYGKEFKILTIAAAFYSPHNVL